MENKCLNCVTLKQRILELEEENKNLRTLQAQGWKGEDKLEILKEDDNWIVIEHRKSKSTGEIEDSKHVIPRNNVKAVWKLLKDNKIEKTKYRELVRLIINHYRIPIGIEEFNGGVNRAKYYFPRYYFPIKILESLKYIKYGGGGTITVIKK